MDTGPVTIRYRADQCVAQFKFLLGIETEIQGSSKIKELKSDELTVEDQLARFEMWAGNIGVFADGHASLDYRLRDSDFAAKLMVDFLGTLSEFLRRGMTSPPLKCEEPVLIKSLRSC